MDEKELKKRSERTSVYFVPAEDKHILPLPAFVTRTTLKELLGTRSLDTFEPILSRSLPK